MSYRCWNDRGDTTPAGSSPPLQLRTSSLRFSRHVQERRGLDGCVQNLGSSLTVEIRVVVHDDVDRGIGGGSVRPALVRDICLSPLASTAATFGRGQREVS